MSTETACPNCGGSLKTWKCSCNPIWPHYAAQTPPAEPAKVREALAELVALVNEQAEDEGCWFIADSMPEAYLQQELRRLHTAIEESARAALATQEGKA